jgi:hypothetical protein
MDPGLCAAATTSESSKPLDSGPMFIFRYLHEAFAHCFCTNSTDFATLIIIYYCWNFGITANALLRRKSREVEGYPGATEIDIVASPRYAFDFGNLARIEDAVGRRYFVFGEGLSSVPVRNANIKRQDEFAIGSVIG